MKPKPLKDKTNWQPGSHGRRWSYSTDIELAVEWAKEEIDKHKWKDSKAHHHVPNETINIRIDVLIGILDKAFEDATDIQSEEKK